MSMRDSLRILRRRWYVLVPILLVGLVSTVGVFRATPPEFEATASLVVLSPTEVVGQQADGPINPFLNFGGSQDTAAQILGVRMGDAKVLEELEKNGVEGDWKFEIQGTAGPLSLVTVTESSSKQALASTDLIVKEAQKQFTDIQLQSGSPLSQLVRLNEVSSPGDPAELYSKKIRNAAAVAGLSVFLAVGSAFAVEGVSRSRKRRQGAHVVLPDPAPDPASWSTEPEEGARTASDAAPSPAQLGDRGTESAPASGQRPAPAAADKAS